MIFPVHLEPIHSKHFSQLLQRNALRSRLEGSTCFAGESTRRRHAHASPSVSSPSVKVPSSALMVSEKRIQSVMTNNVFMNTFRMLITPIAIQDLVDEPEASKRSRLRAWNVLQRVRLVLSRLECCDSATGPRGL